MVYVIILFIQSLSSGVLHPSSSLVKSETKNFVDPEASSTFGNMEVELCVTFNNFYFFNILGKGSRQISMFTAPKQLEG